MQVMDFDAQLLHIVCQVFSHLLGQRRHQDALALCDAFANLRQQVIDLPFGWAYTDLWVDKAGWADDLFDDGIAMLIFVGTRSRGDEERLVDLPLEFCECQWSI